MCGHCRTGPPVANSALLSVGVREAIAGAAPPDYRRVMPTVQAEEFVDVRGAEVRVLRSGEGPTLLYLHGSGDHGAWLPVLEQLAGSFSVVRPDHPGFNRSPESAEIDSVHELAFFYLDLLAELGIDRFSVIGSSLGGWLAADLATIEPARVERLVLVGSAGLRVEGVAVPDMFTLGAEALADLLYQDDDARGRARDQAAALDTDPAAMAAYLQNRITTAHLAWNPYFHDPKLPQRLHRVQAPTLLVWGREDRVFPPAHAEAWRALLPDARVELVDGAGHLPHVEQPQRFVELVAPFLAR
jgi:pimeloyl-ACP methyl ester carboxylesterase